MQLTEKKTISLLRKIHTLRLINKVIGNMNKTFQKFNAVPNMSSVLI